jgi:hypothetical protein
MCRGKEQAEERGEERREVLCSLAVADAEYER